MAARLVLAEDAHRAAIGFGIARLRDEILLQRGLRPEHIHAVVADLLEAVVAQGVAVAGVAHIVQADAEAVAVFGAFAGGEAAAHARLAQVLDQGDILDRVVLKRGSGEITGDAEGIGAVDDVVGERQVIAAAQTLAAIRRSFQPTAQIHPGAVHIFDRHVAHGEVMIDVAVHAARRADAVIEPVLDLQIVDDDVSGGRAVAQHQAAVPQGGRRLLG